MKIIIIEDTGIVRIKMEKTLQKHGFTNLESINSHNMTLSTLEFVLKNSNLVFIDYDNREINVKAIMTKIRSLHTKEDLPVVVLSATPEITTLKSILNDGGNDVLLKPFSDVKLMEKVFSNTERPTVEATLVLDPPLASKNNEEDDNRYMPEWHDDFAVGIKEIDREHKELIEKYELLYQKMKSGDGSQYYGELVEFLKSYVHTHFENEEAFQEKIGYPDRTNHHQIHIEFKDQLLDIVKTHEGQAITNLDLIKFNLFIKNWLTHHILVEDRKIENYVKENNVSL